MQAAQFDALVDAAHADGGVRFDGLSARADDEADTPEGGFAFRTPDGEHLNLSEDEFREVAAEHVEYVTNWYFWTHVVGSKRADDVDAGDAHHHRRAFLRWLECADERAVPERYEALTSGATREWGQIRITTALAEDGHRRYEIRHEADADVPVDELRTYTDPYGIREVVTYDDRGRYRPLKTAPSLQTGWALTDLDQRGVFEAVNDVIYPATVVNWNLERHGELDVTHWEEMAERQTGIYDVIDELDGEAVNWIAESCCVDSQCLRRREWQLNEEETLDPDSGDGIFPCREPCSVVVAAARKWTMLEREETHTYEFELTESEKEQVEDIIAAVADGTADDIREADVYEGANRYRARFLRAKRFDEHGNLSGTPTECPDADE